MSIFLSDNYGKNDPFFQQRKEVEKNLENVKTIIAVHSGKGGVGKSTFSINFAAALSKKDFQVGLLDADLDCPSLHLMSGINDRVLVNEFGRFIPLTTSFGLKVISVGNMVESNSIAN
ncbi:MAG: P-loop NTPase, partial [Candidatus Diapherotrites archaeon]